MQSLGSRRHVAPSLMSKLTPVLDYLVGSNTRLRGSIHSFQPAHRSAAITWAGDLDSIDFLGDHEDQMEKGGGCDLSTEDMELLSGLLHHPLRITARFPLHAGNVLTSMLPVCTAFHSMVISSLVSKQLQTFRAAHAMSLTDAVSQLPLPREEREAWLLMKFAQAENRWEHCRSRNCAKIVEQANGGQPIDTRGDLMAAVPGDVMRAVWIRPGTAVTFQLTKNPVNRYGATKVELAEPDESAVTPIIEDGMSGDSPYGMSANSKIPLSSEVEEIFRRDWNMIHDLCRGDDFERAAPATLVSSETVCWASQVADAEIIAILQEYMRVTAMKSAAKGNRPPGNRREDEAQKWMS